MTKVAPDIDDYYSGDTLSFPVTLKNENTGERVPLAGGTLRWVLAESPTDVPIVTKEIGSGITVTDEANGEFTIKIEPADTESLSGQHYHETEFVDSVGNVSTVVVGYIQINPDLA